MRDEVTAFQLGSSVVITLPKELGIKPGQKLKFKPEKGGLLLRKKKMSEAQIRKLVDSLKVDLHLKKNLTAEQLDDLYEESY